MQRMMTFQTYYKTVLFCGALTLASANINAHSVHDDHVDKKIIQVHDVNVLIRQYSLTGDDHLIEQGWQVLSEKGFNRKKSHSHRKATKESSSVDYLATELPTDKITQHWLQAAWLAQAEHQFDEARYYVKQVLQLEPQNAQAWLLEASIATVQGDAEKAAKACQRVALSVSPIVTVACKARLAKTQKEKSVAYKKLTKLSTLTALYKGKTLVVEEQQITAWVNSVIADLAMSLNDISTAKRLYKESMTTFPSVQVRASYTDALMHEKKYKEVVSFIASDEETPALAVRRLLAEKKLQRNIHHRVHEMDHLFSDWIAEKDFKHAREMAVFYLDIAGNQQLAYELALENIKVQREEEDILLLKRAQPDAPINDFAMNNMPMNNLFIEGETVWKI